MELQHVEHYSPPTFASHLDDQRRLEMSWKIWAKTGVLCEMSPLNATISIFPFHCILHNGGIGWLRFFFSILADTLYFLSRSESPRQFRFNFYIEGLRLLNRCWSWYIYHNNYRLCQGKGSLSFSFVPWDFPFMTWIHHKKYLLFYI